MRTKTLITTAALGIASAAALQAQVYSVNAVGYINIPVKPGFNLLANQLNQTDNTVAALFDGAENFMIVYKYSPGTGYTINNYEPPTAPGAGDALWDNPDMTLSPGEGFWCRNLGDEFTWTVVGEVPQGTGLTVDLAAGFNLVSSIVPQAGLVETDLGLPVEDFDSVYTYDPASGYTIYGTDDAGWLDEEPTIAVGQGFWARKVAAGTWTRDFSVN